MIYLKYRKSRELTVVYFHKATSLLMHNQLETRLLRNFLQESDPAHILVVLTLTLFDRIKELVILEVIGYIDDQRKDAQVVNEVYDIDKLWRVVANKRDFDADALQNHLCGNRPERKEVARPDRETCAEAYSAFQGKEPSYFLNQESPLFEKG